MNKIIIIGNLGGDCVTRPVGEGYATNFNVAVTDKKPDLVDKKTGEVTKQEETTWFNCTKWSKDFPKVADYLTKGTKVVVEGKISVRTYKDKDNVFQAAMDIRVTELELLSSKKQSEPVPMPAEEQEKQPAYVGENDEIVY